LTILSCYSFKIYILYSINILDSLTNMWVVNKGCWLLNTRFLAQIGSIFTYIIGCNRRTRFKLWWYFLYICNQHIYQFQGHTCLSHKVPKIFPHLSIYVNIFYTQPWNNKYGQSNTWELHSYVYLRFEICIKLSVIFHTILRAENPNCAGSVYCAVTPSATLLSGHSFPTRIPGYTRIVSYAREQLLHSADMTLQSRVATRCRLVLQIWTVRVNIWFLHQQNVTTW